MNSTNSPETEKRLRRLICIYLAVFTAGVLYAVLCSTLHISVPCLFHSITHLKCPGCGVTDMCLCLLRLDFRGAWKANPGILTLIPFLVYLAAVLSLRYVKTGRPRLNKAENILVCIACIGLIIFGILRNIPK